MEIFQTVGIDISKLTLDARVHTSKAYKSFKNEDSGFKSLLKWAAQNNKFSIKNTLFVFEHTGLYSYLIAVFLGENNCKFTVVPGLEIKRSLGITRGKDDKLDATKIARYAYRLRDEISLTKLPAKPIRDLKLLLSLREKLVKQRAGYKSSLKEQKRVYDKQEFILLFETQENIINCLSGEIQKIEKKMDEIIGLNDTIAEHYKLIISIKGVGRQTALNIIVYTENFTKFKTSRQFASYSGIAPFPYMSGTSIKGKTKVSHLANKKLKSLLDMCAVSAINHNPEMRMYYQKKVEEGKHKMSVINAVRNKLLARVFAVVKRKTAYIEIMKFAA